MRRWLTFAFVGVLSFVVGGDEADGRGFGGFRGGGGFSGFSSFGGSRSESFGRSGFDSFEGSRSSSFNASRSAGYGGWEQGRAAGGSSYDRSWSGSRGGSIDTSGERGFVAGPRGVAGGSSRDVTATGPGGRTYDSSKERGFAVGPYGRAVGGGERSATATGPRGTASSSWESAFARGGHFSTDVGLSHYSSFGAVSGAHVTTYRSHSVVNAQAGFVRGTFGYYNAFRPNWYRLHPNCWTAAAWAADIAWTVASWASLATWWAVPAQTINYDYGNTVVIQDNSVNINGQDVGTPEEYAKQATTLADQGQKADAPPDQEWKPLGVFALVQGDSTASNNVFQLAVNKEGVIRGNYYDGVLDTTTPVYGSVDKKTQRAAWTIGKTNDRVYEAGIENLTQKEAPILVHIGTTKTQQWMLVRVEQSQDQK